MGKNVAVFVDVANIFYAAKAAGVDIDYVTLLKSASAGRDLVRAYAYTGLDPDNENQRNFHSFLARNGYKVVSKDIRKYGDGKVKANLDIELVVDMMKTARNLDIAIVVSGDGDFAPAIRAVQEMGVRCEVISFRGNTSSDLIEVADLFTDITQLAKVEKGSRSGRRVAEDDADLSMTEVPDKQTEGTGRGRGRGRGRERGADREPVAASAANVRGRGRRRTPDTAETAGGAVVALPGERLSKALVGGLTEADLAAAEVFTLEENGHEVAEEDGPLVAAVPGGDEGDLAEGARRRRRRGGRGRGRGRGRENGDVPAETPPRAAAPARPSPEQEDDEDEAPPAPRPRSTPFGSVWDSQLGTSTPAPAAMEPLSEEEYDDEPEIPEYLIAERNRGRGGARGGGRGGGARGGRAAYQSAIARERFGTGGRSGGINRYPDVSERERTTRGGGGAARRDDRGGRPERAPAPAASMPRGGGEWSEVPPELEELLRSQLGQKAGPRPQPVPAVLEEAVEVAGEDTVTAEAAAAPDGPAATSRRRLVRKTATAAADEAAASTAAPARRRTTRKTAATADAPEASEASAATTEAAPATAKRTRKPKAAAEAASEDAATGAPKPRRRTSRATAGDAEAAAATLDGADGAPATTPRRRTTRKTAATETT